MGFAAALEVVPALILSALRAGTALETTPVATSVEQEQREERQQEQAETEPETAAETGLPPQLQQLIAATERGDKVAVRQVAKELRIGSSKANRLLQQAAELGALHKTAGGYVAA